MSPAKSAPQVIFDNLKSAESKFSICYFTSPVENYICRGPELLKQARQITAQLEHQNIKKRSIIALALPTGQSLHAAWLGCLWYGAIPSIIAPPSPRMEFKKYIDGIKSILSSHAHGGLITNSDTAEKFAPYHKGIVVTLDLNFRQTVNLADEWSSKEVFIVQHSSGTTGAPKAIAYNSDQFLRHSLALQQSLNLEPNIDIIGTWLPLYHDMGFVACFVTPLLLGIRFVETSPFEWINHPESLFEMIEDKGVTLCWMPNFAFHVMSQSRVSDKKNWDLSNIKAMINCSEPVMAKTIQEFCQTYKDNGLSEDKVLASYAMAENVFVVTQNKLNTPVTKSFDRKSVEVHRKVKLSADKASNVELFSSGVLVPSTELKILDANLSPLGAGEIGQICIRGSHLFDGYLDRPDLTQKALDKNGWYFTGDEGFLWDKELFVTGRIKDTIIIRGRNIQAHDLEQTVSSLEGVNSGRVATFGVSDPQTGTEKLILLYEKDPKSNLSLGKLMLSIRREVMSVFEVYISDLKMLPARSIVKSSSGKVARLEMKKRYIQGGL